MGFAVLLMLIFMVSYDGPEGIDQGEYHFHHGPHDMITFAPQPRMQIIETADGETWIVEDLIEPQPKLELFND